MHAGAMMMYPQSICNYNFEKEVSPATTNYYYLTVPTNTVPAVTTTHHIEDSFAFSPLIRHER
jgi:hypothetical protein